MWHEIFLWAWRLAVIVFLWEIWHELRKDVAYELRLARVSQRTLIFDSIWGELKEIKEAIKAQKVDKPLPHGGEEGGAGIQKIINTLRREKVEAERRSGDHETPDYNKGWEDGLEWAREAPYENLKRVTNDSLPPPDKGWVVGIQPMYRDIIEDLAQVDKRGLSDVMAWASGWRDAVRDFWREVQKKP